MSPKPAIEYEDKIVSLRLSTRAYNYCQMIKTQTISGLLSFYNDNGCRIPKCFPNVGDKTVNELEVVCRLFLNGMYKLKGKDDSELLIHCGLSVRAYNYCSSHKLFTVDDLLRFYRENKCSIPHGQNAGRKTLAELEAFCSQNYVPDSVPTSEQLDMPIVEEKSDELPFYCTSFTLEDKQFGWAHHEKYGHFPMLWVIEQTYDADQDVDCLFSTTPVIEGRKTLSFVEQAKAEGVSHTCIKQRFERAVDKLFNSKKKSVNGKVKYWVKILTKENFNYLIDSVEGADFISTLDYDNTLRKFNQEEGTSFRSEFILQLIASLSGSYYIDGGYTLSNYYNYIYLIHNDICNVFDFHNFSLGFDEMLQDCDVHTELNIRNYIEDSLYWRTYEFNMVDRVVKACKSYILHKYGLYETYEKDVIEIVPSKINWSEVIFQLLEKEVSGLTMEEIFTCLQCQYPDHRLTESRIRRAINQDSRIQFQRDGNGRTKFLLAIHDVPSSIRDAIVRKLESSVSPVSLEDVASFVQTYFPSSSNRSIRTTMCNDSRARFVQYKGGLWGLAGKSYSDEYKLEEVVAHQGQEERLISLKAFIAEKLRFPDTDSLDPEEVSLARWMERHSEKKAVIELLREFEDAVWKACWTSCEEYIRGHYKKLPTRESNPVLYKWYVKAMDDYGNDNLTQEQRKMMLHLAMQIR
jgi:hypothetical protein